MGKNMVKVQGHLSKMMSLLKSYKGWLIAGVFFAIVGACFGVIAPVIISDISNEIQDCLAQKISQDAMWLAIKKDIIVAGICIVCGFIFHIHKHSLCLLQRLNSVNNYVQT